MLLRVFGVDPKLNLSLTFPNPVQNTYHVHAVMGPLVEAAMLSAARGPRGGTLVPLDIVATTTVHNTRRPSSQPVHILSTPHTITFESGVGTGPVHHTLLPLTSTLQLARGMYRFAHRLSVTGTHPHTVPVRIGTSAPVTITAIPAVKERMCTRRGHVPSLVMVEVPTGTLDAETGVVVDLTEFEAWIVMLSWPGQVQVTDG
jgi:hypothetical protein